MKLLNETAFLLASNLVFTCGIGLGTFSLFLGKPKKLIATASVITVFAALGSAAAYLTDSLLPKKYEVFALLLYTLSLAVIYGAVLGGVYLANRKFFHKIKKYIHLSAFNTAVTGAILMISENSRASAEGFDFLKYLSMGFISGLGFILVSLILSAAAGRIDSSKVPFSFRGFPAMLVYLGIISMALYSAGII